MKMWSGPFGMEFTRRRALRKAPSGPVRDFFAAPLPTAAARCREVPIVSLDLEATGTNPKRDTIVSMGLVEIHDMTIRLDTAWHRIIQPGQEMPEASAILHRITDDRAAQGAPLEEALPQLLARLAGKPILVHFGRIEQEFLDAACRRLYGIPFVIPTIDTLVLAHRFLTLRNHGINSGDLRLFNLRPRFNLPRYSPHNAINDALAAAELFLAMVTEMFPKGEFKLRHVLTGLPSQLGSWMARQPGA